MKPVLAGWLSSSADPTSVSNTVRGFILSASSLIVFVAAQVLHIQLTAGDVVALGTQIGAVAGALWFFYGLLMKGVIRAGSVK